MPLENGGIMMPAPSADKGESCYSYWMRCTEEYGEYWAQQHLGKKYYKSVILSQINAFASWARIELGLMPGDVYTVFMPTTVQSIVAFYALNKIGVIVNFVHPLLPPEVLKESVLQANSKGVMILDILSKKHVDTLNELGLPVLVCHSSEYGIAPLRAAIGGGELLLKKMFPKIENRDEYSKVIKRFMKANVHDHCDADKPAVYLNGGGTTGKSKTIMLSSRQINDIVYSMSQIDRIHVPGREAEVVVLPLFHCFGLCVGLHMAVCNGARIIPMMQFDARYFNYLIKHNEVVGFIGIPVMFNKLMKEKHFENKGLKNIRMAFCGGDDAPQSQIDAFNEKLEKWGAPGRLRQGYGLTEVGSVCCCCTNWDYKNNSIGKAISGVTMQIWDDDCHEVPRGTIGEIVISGPTIMMGYFQNGDDTPGKGLYTDENGVKWVRSGDLGYEDEDDYFFFVGRKKRVIKISGYNVYPDDIEKRLSEFPFVGSVCLVKGWSNGKQLIRMFVSFKSQGNEEDYKRMMLECIEENFSKFSVPREIIVVDKLPETPLMKVDFMKLTQNRPEDKVWEPSDEKPDTGLLASLTGG